MTDAESWAQQVRAHIERYIGRIDTVFGGNGVDVLHVGPVESRAFHTLITVGMSSEPMQLPPDVDAPRRVELMMTLPERWRLGADMHDPAHWPTRLLQSLSHHKPVRWGDTVPNGEPPRPLAPDTNLCGVIIAPSLLVPVAFYELNIAGERVAFYSAIPLYREELELRQREGMEALLGRLLQKDINDVVEPRRRNVAKKRFGIF